MHNQSTLTLLTILFHCHGELFLTKLNCLPLDQSLRVILKMKQKFLFQIQVLLGDYLDVQNTATQQGPMTFTDSR